MFRSCLNCYQTKLWNVRSSSLSIVSIHTDGQATRSFSSFCPFECSSRIPARKRARRNRGRGRLTGDSKKDDLLLPLLVMLMLFGDALALFKTEKKPPERIGCSLVISPFETRLGSFYWELVWLANIISCCRKTPAAAASLFSQTIQTLRLQESRFCQERRMGILPMRSFAWRRSQKQMKASRKTSTKSIRAAEEWEYRDACRRQEGN